MTTTPTLLIQIRSVTSAGNVNYKTRPATHDELIAAMPRCGTCARRGTYSTNKGDDVWDEHYCKLDNRIVEPTFGCTEHKERV